LKQLRVSVIASGFGFGRGSGGDEWQEADVLPFNLTTNGLQTLVAWNSSEVALER
jgi:hypothetical protein